MFHQSCVRTRLLASIGLAALSVPAAAQTVQPAPAYHAPSSAEIIVTAPFARDIGAALGGVSVLSGEALTRELQPTIGETLSRQPGVSATSFGPNASRPVLRGFQGDRVRVLTDGIGSFDVSSTSVDHAVVINPLTADRIEVLRGPSALLFGSSAIGGVVNVIDSRIPRRVPDEPIHADVIGTLGSAADERSIAASVDAPLASRIVVHIDSSYTRTHDLDTGGFILTPALRAQAAMSSDPEVARLASLNGELPNSKARSWDLGAGVAFVGDASNFGVSIARHDSRYGVPVRYDVTGEGEAEQVQLDARQTRVDLRGEVALSGPFEKIRLRGGYADYRHDEVEPSGEIGTSFFSDGYEARAELVQADRGGWRGALGAQFLSRDFNVVGEEKFLPRNETRQYGIFALQEFELGAITAEAGGRYEHSVARADADADIGNPALKRTFDAISASAGASLQLAEGWRAGLNLSRTERAPTAEELFANGPHAGTQAFELGSPALAKEKSWGVEATLRGKGRGYSLSASAYHNWFSDYIYEAQVEQTVCETAAGGRDVEFPCFQRMQASARYYGFEVEGALTLVRIGQFDIVSDALADYVRARIIGSGPAPRIPALRLLGGLEAQSQRIDGRVEVEWVDDQNRVTGFETPTSGYTMVNASIAFRPFADARQTSILLSANNIFDITARRHASVLKDYAPLAGRDIRLTVRLAL